MYSRGFHWIAGNKMTSTEKYQQQSFSFVGLFWLRGLLQGSSWLVARGTETKKRTVQVCKVVHKGPSTVDRKRERKISPQVTK